jgi:hypothetical protein
MNQKSQEIWEKLADEIAPWGGQQFEFQLGKFSYTSKMPTRADMRTGRSAFSAMASVGVDLTAYPAGTTGAFWEGLLIEAECFLPILLTSMPPHWHDDKSNFSLEKVGPDELALVWARIATHWPFLTVYRDALEKKELGPTQSGESGQEQ